MDGRAGCTLLMKKFWADGGEYEGRMKMEMTCKLARTIFQVAKARERKLLEGLAASRHWHNYLPWLSRSSRVECGRRKEKGRDNVPSMSVVVGLWSGDVAAANTD